MKQIDLREGARRQHRAVSLFAVIQCWISNLDGIVLERAHLQRLLGLNRFKKTRVKWLQEDLKEFFPYQQQYQLSGNSNSFRSLIVSRLPLKDFMPPGSMTTKDRLAGIKEGGPKIALFKMWSPPKSKDVEKLFEGMIPFFADSANYDERFLSSYLSLLSQGQISPHRLPPLQEGDTE